MSISKGSVPSSSIMVAVLMLVAVVSMAAERPNILFCIADDWGYHFPGSGTGEKMPRVPNFEKIASSGMMFENAHAAAPSCTPSRNAILTGAHPWKLKGGANLFSVFPKEFVSYPNLLKDAGYHVGYTRKCFGPGKIPAGIPHPAGNKYGDFRKFLAERKTDQPFCFWFGSNDPHRNYTRRLTKNKGLGPDSVSVPPSLPDVEIVRWDIADYYAEVERFDSEVGYHLKILQEEGLLENTLIVMTSDHGWPFPRGKCNLYDVGTHVPLVVQWNGVIQPGQKISDFVNLADFAPTFLEVAGLKRHKQMTTRSLVPVFKSEPKDGLRDPERDHVFTFKERHCPSQLDTIGGYPMRAIHTKDYLYIMNLEPNWWPVGTREVSIRGQRFADIDPGPSKEVFVENTEDMDNLEPVYALTVAKRPADELYHKASDPRQLKNVAQDKKHSKALKSLKKKLMKRLKDDKDPRIMGHPEVYEFEPFLLSHDKQRFNELKEKRQKEIAGE